jgi:hypothetical protein
MYGWGERRPACRKKALVRVWEDGGRRTLFAAMGQNVRRENRNEAEEPTRRKGIIYLISEHHINYAAAPFQKQITIKPKNYNKRKQYKEIELVA